MATVSELRILFTAINTASRVANSLEKDLARLDAASSKQARNAIALNKAAENAQNSLNKAAETGSNKIIAAQGKLDKAYENRVKVSKSAYDSVKSASDSAANDEKDALDKVIKSHNDVYNSSKALQVAEQTLVDTRVVNANKVETAEKALSNFSSQRSSLDIQNSKARAAAIAKDNEVAKKSITDLSKAQTEYDFAKRRVGLATQGVTKAAGLGTELSAQKAQLRADKELFAAKEDFAKKQEALDKAQIARNDLLARPKNIPRANLAEENLARRQRVADFDKQELQLTQQLSAVKQSAATKDAQALGQVAQARQELNNLESAAAAQTNNFAQVEIAGRQKVAQAYATGNSAIAASTAKIQQEKQAVASVTSAVTSDIESKGAAVEQAASKAAAGMQELGNSSVLASTAAKAGLIAVGVAAAATTAVVLKLGFGYNSAKEAALTAFTGILKSGPEATKLLSDLDSWTRKTALSFNTARDAAAEFIARGISVKDVIPDLEAITNAAASFPRPIEDSVQRISYAIGQITQSSKLHSQDIRQLTEVGVNAWKYLSDATGKSVDEIQKDSASLGLTGPKTAAIILAGMKAQYGGMLDLQKQTFRGQVSSASRNFQEISGIFSKPLFDIAKSGLQELNKALTDPKNIQAAKELGDTIASSMRTAASAVKDLHDFLSDPFKLVLDVSFGKDKDSSSWVKNLKKDLDIFFKDAWKNTPGSVNATKNIAEGTQSFLNSTGIAPDDEKKLDSLNKKLKDLQATRDAFTKSGGQKLSSSAIQDLSINGFKFDSSSNQSQIDSVQKSIDDLKVKLGLIPAPAEAAANAIADTAESLNEAKNKLESRAATLRDNIDKEFKKPTIETTQAQITALQTKLSQTPERDKAADSLYSLEQAARDSARGFERQSQAIDDNIRSIQRQWNAQDRLTDRAKLAADGLKDIADAKKDLADFDRDAKRQSELSSIRSGPRGDRARKALQDQFDKEDAALKRAELEKKIKEAQKKSSTDLGKFDKDANRQAIVDGLNDQKDAIQKAAKNAADKNDLDKEAIQNQIHNMDITQRNADEAVAQLEGQNKIAKDRFDILSQAVQPQADLTKAVKAATAEFNTSILPDLADIARKTNIINSSIKSANDDAQKNERYKEQYNPEGRASGGPIIPGNMYRVHRDELIYTKTKGSVVPVNAQGGGGNHQKMINYGPITIYPNGNNKKSNDALDQLFQSF